MELLGMGAAGARYGLASAAYFGLGAIAAMLFAGLYLMPVYYGSGARTVPEYLGMRFDGKTRTLNAGLFLAMTIFSAGISLYAMARLVLALGLFERVESVERMGAQWFLIVAICVPAALVLVYVLLGGLMGTMYGQVLQVFMVVAGLLPVTVLGLMNIGGWSGLKARVGATSYLEAWGGGHGVGSGAGLAGVGLAVMIGSAMGAGYWCTDFRVVQTAMAAKNVNAARRAPMIAAAMRVILPLLMIVPGLIAIGMPTPQTETMVREENGAIIHEITVAPKAAEAGKGLVPAETDSVTDPMEGNVLMDAGGQTRLYYSMAMPEALGRFLPTGLLGLGLAALLACLLSGVAASMTAFNTVFTYDLYQAHLRKAASDARLLVVGRWAAVGFAVLAVGAGCAAMRAGILMQMLALVFAVVNAPLLATVLLGVFWKRATGLGAFAGLLAGVAAAVAHMGLTVGAEQQRGWDGGWWAVLHHYPSGLAQSFWTAVIGLGANAAVTVFVSLCTEAKSETELTGLVHGLTEVQRPARVWWMRPERLATVVLVAGLVVCVLVG
jgi:SSS family solute:Na+ symporter